MNVIFGSKFANNSSYKWVLLITQRKFGKSSSKVPRIPTICLNTGKRMPALGLGTWQAKPGEVGEVVKTAIDLGYRLFDCAMLYGNECEIGKAITQKICDGAVRREELFIVTKLWNTFHQREQVVPACRQSLENFGLDYLDLYLIHWPVAQKMTGKLNVSLPFKNAKPLDYDYVKTWEGMEECVELKLTKTIGVSNFNSKQIDRLVTAANIKPVVNEIEVHPLLNQKKLIKYCKSLCIEVIAYSPFASPARPWAKPDDPKLDFKDPRLVKIAKHHKKTTAQVILRHIIQNGAVPVPKSVKKERLIENADVFNFCLTPKEMNILDCFDCNGRVVPASELKGFPNYPFNIEY